MTISRWLDFETLHLGANVTPYIYIQSIQENLIKPYDDVTEFFDLHPGLSLEEKNSFIRFGRNSTHFVVSKEAYDSADPIEDSASAAQDLHCL